MRMKIVKDSKIEGTLENVLLHGGGSLGAFGCGVFKVIVKNNVKIDIIAGWNEFGHVAASLNPRLVLHY
jgi:hypothetical protein